MEFEGVEITWLGHASIRVRLDDGTTLLVDPWLEGNPACPESEYQQDGIDAIYVTHGHFDHMTGVESTARANEAAVFAIHELATHFEGLGLENVTGSNKGGTVEGPGGVKATLVDACHSAGISGDDGIISGGEAAGWVLEIPGGPTLYHAGDTTLFGDMSLIGEIYEPDLAFLPIGGHFTMGPELAARAGRLLGVEKVVPVHFGTFPILTGTPDELAEAASGGFEVLTPDIG